MKLNRLVASVRNALLDDKLRMIYGKRIHAPSEFFDWIKLLDDERFDDFFTDFAGQARIRWHYGVAHPLLCSFEDSFMADHGRGWLPGNNADRARTFVRMCRKLFFLLGIGIELEDTSVEQTALFNFQNQSYSLSTYFKEAELTPKCA